MISKLITNMTVKSRILAVLIIVIATVTVALASSRASQVRTYTDTLLEERLKGNANMTFGIFNTVQTYTIWMLNTVASHALHGFSDVEYDLEIQLRQLFNNMNREVGGVRSYENIAVFDADFNIVAVADPGGELPDISMFADSMDEIMAGVWSSPTYVSAGGRLQILFTQPVFNRGSFAGLAVMTENTEMMSYFLRDFVQIYDSFVNLVDSSGIIFFSNRPDAYMGRHVDELGVTEAFGYIPMNTVFEHTSAITGIDKIAYITHDTYFNWTIVSFFDADAVESTAQIIFMSLLPMVSGVILATAFVVLIIHWSLKPLTDLAIGAKELSRGNLAVTFRINRNDEISQVAVAFTEIVRVLNILRSNFKKAENAMNRGEMEYHLEDSRLGGIFDEMLASTGSIVGYMKESMRQAEEASKAKSDFLSTMSHEIRTPMNAIIGVSGIELEREGHQHETIVSLDMINNSGKMLLGIINDILDLTKIETGKFELVPVTYNTISLINDTVRLNSMRIGDNPINFVVKVTETLPEHLFGDELRIKQILNNILSNAIKYTEQGSIIFKVDSLKSGKNVVLIFSIKDTGQGMTEEQLKQLYEKYTMFNQEANRKTEGTGLGMSITKNLVELMGGKIEVQSIMGEGSTFSVYLTQRVEGEGIIGKEVAENLQNFKTTEKTKQMQIERTLMPYGSVLIVDDLDANLFVAKGLMNPYGLNIETAVSGCDSIEKICDGNEYDIIFMDHMMPGMDGIEATKQLRSMGYARPIVALTANAVVGQKELFLENGFDDFISKPIDVRHLDALLNTLIRDKQPPEVLEKASAAEFVKQQEAAVEENRNPLALLKSICGLEVEPALDAMSGLVDVYVDTAKLMLRLLPERLEKMDKFVETDINAFGTEVHGLKSVLKNIGAAILGSDAAQLENAALENNHEFCNESYPAFKAALVELKNNLALVFPEKTAEKAADISLLVQALPKARTSAENFDRDNALAIISEYGDFTYGAEADKLLKEIIFALDAFDCDGALTIIKKLEAILHESV